MFDSLSQPLVALWFIVAGAAAYVTYEVFYALKTLFPLKAVALVTDFLSIVAAGGVFFFTAAKCNYGRLLFYEFFCFITAFFIARLTLKTVLRKVFGIAINAVKEKTDEVKKSLYKNLKSAQTKLERRKYERQQQTNGKRNDDKVQRTFLRLRGKGATGNNGTTSGMYYGNLRGKTRKTASTSGNGMRPRQDKRSGFAGSLQKRLRRKRKRGNIKEFFAKQEFSQPSDKTV